MDESQQVSIYFDGEELNADVTIGECEVEDMDTLDVHVK